MRRRRILVFRTDAVLDHVSDAKIRQIFSVRVLPQLRSLNTEYGFSAPKDEPEISIIPCPEAGVQTHLEHIFTDEEDRKSVRIVICHGREQLNPEIFANSQLVILVRVTTGQPLVRNIPKLQQGCEFHVDSKLVLPLLSDVLFDIAISNSHALRPIRRRFEEKCGYGGYLQARGSFFVKTGGWAEIQIEDQNLNYAPVALLGRANGESVGATRKRIATNWDEFVTKGCSDYLLPSGEAVEDLRSAPRIGRHVSVNSGSRLLSKCDAGPHELLMLVRSPDSRKSPSIRGELQAVFGARPKLRKFRIDREGVTLPATKLASLISDGWIHNHRFFLGK